MEGQQNEPGPKDPFTKFVGFLPDYGEILVAKMTVQEAKDVCKSLPGCKGFTLHGSDELQDAQDQAHIIRFNSLWQLHKIHCQTWTAYKYEAPFTRHDGFLPAGDDLLILQGTVEEAKVEAMDLPGCCGFTFAGADGDGEFKIYFKSRWELRSAGGAAWTSYRYEGPPVLERRASTRVVEHVTPNVPGKVLTVEKVVYVPLAPVAHPTAAFSDSPLAVPADPASCLYHPADAYLGENMTEALRFFRTHGLLLLPDAVPQHLLDAARAAVDREGSRDVEAEEVLAALRDSGIWDVVKMLVDEPQFPETCQVAVADRFGDQVDMEVMRGSYSPARMHIDGMPDGERTFDIMNFTILVGIPLDATNGDFMGNFAVFPGSHQRLAESIRKEGLDPLRSKDWFEPLKRMSGADSHPYLPLKVVPGQAYIAHYQTLHFVMPNLCGADPRRVMYFRIWSKRGDGGHYMKADTSLLSDIWREFPAVKAMDA